MLKRFTGPLGTAMLAGLTLLCVPTPALAASAPAVAWAAPLNGATVSGVLDGSTCLVKSSDPDGIKSVQFFLDGRSLGYELSAPYNCWGLDTASWADGAHVLKATAVDRTGSTASSTITVYKGSKTPAVPTGLKVASAADGRVSLDWADNAGSFGHYQVYRDGVMVADGPTASAYTDSGLTNGRAYSYRVSAGVLPNESAWTGAVSATPTASSPTAPAPTPVPAPAPAPAPAPTSPVTYSKIFDSSNAGTVNEFQADDITRTASFAGSLRPDGTGDRFRIQNYSATESERVTWLNTQFTQQGRRNVFDMNVVYDALPDVYPGHSLLLAIRQMENSFGGFCSGLGQPDNVIAFDLNTMGKRYGLRLNGGPGSPLDSSAVQKKLDFGPIVVGELVKWRFDVTWSSTAGHVAVWKNGVKLADVNTPIGFQKGCGGNAISSTVAYRAQHGFYRHPYNTSTSVMRSSGIGLVG